MVGLSCSVVNLPVVKLHDFRRPCLWLTESHSEVTLSAWSSGDKQALTFRALPRVPQVLHADELVVPVEAVVLGLGVVVVEVFSQELQE